MENSDVVMKKRILDADPEAVLIDGFDDCILGVGHSATRRSVPVYSLRKMIDKVAAARGWTLDQAGEYIEESYTFKFIGPRTPIFVEYLQ